MKVWELKEMLEEMDDDREVIIAKDREGNMHSPLDEVWPGTYYPIKKWYGNFEVFKKDEEGQLAIVLLPIN
ncbi:MAG: hypothetical protein CL489_10385 [Acidobacteria bacterium]|nr:hypothetical protein [Acidobacteriota bacterium]|tara:strand:+ start:17152 stop:17364 length:213 start_codon:yes stop_codon:yes gene_type:complete